jgi:hypothetical protein
MKKQVKRERQRRQTDPEYRTRYNEMRARYVRERRRTDPAFRERLAAAQRRYRARRKQAEKPSPSAQHGPDGAR